MKIRAKWEDSHLLVSNALEGPRDQSSVVADTQAADGTEPRLAVDHLKDSLSSKRYRPKKRRILVYAICKH